MGFKPWKWRINSILPSAYISYEKWKLKWPEKIVDTLNKLIVDFPFLSDLLEKYKIFINKEEIKNYIIDKLENKLPKKENKKNVLKILSVKLSKDFVEKNDLTVLEGNKESYYFAEIEDFKNYFIEKNIWEWAKFKKGFCFVCEQEKDDLIDFPNSKWISFPYKFYNLDKPWFAYDLDRNNWYKSFWVCKDCFGKIKIWYNYFKNDLFKQVLWDRAYVFPSILFDKIDKKKIFQVLEKYSNYDKLESNLKQQLEAREFKLDELWILFEYGTEQDKQIINEKNFVRLNFIFWQIDGAKSDELKIKYFLKDIIPSKLAKYYESIKKIDKYKIAKNLFTEKVLDKKWNFSDNLNSLFLFPTYEKWKRVWNLKEFFEWNNEFSENYYYFLNRVLHWEKLQEDWIWSLVYEKLKKDFKKSYKMWKDSKWWFVFNIWEIYQVLIYLKENKYLDFKIKTMEFKLSQDNEKIKNLENYFNQNNLFTSYDEMYSALIGLYVMLLIKKQKKEIGSMPFMTEIDFERFDYDKLEKLLLKARNKFNKYSGKKFDYYPDLYKTILELGSKIKKDLPMEKIAYYFSIGMEILPDIYWQDKEGINE
jgi:CRISPR-associated protein Cas8b/Csh1 subtype I-B